MQIVWLWQPIAGLVGGVLAAGGQWQRNGVDRFGGLAARARRDACFPQNSRGCSLASRWSERVSQAQWIQSAF